MEPIILASSSPRRQEILKLLNIPFKVIIPNIDETISSAIEPEEIPEFLAREKVTAVIHSLPPQQEILWILGADTIILKEGKIFGKPDSRIQAEAFLREFSGKTHQVITSVVLYNGRKKTFVSKNAVTKVTFSELSDKEINWYLDTEEWHGAAGGYRIQSLASCFIKSIEGTQSCVTGLPIFELYDMFKEQGYSLLE
ncbi:MAG: Maf family protein [Spirochaetia bacterium]|nr:Maf family protein [Spirochaetia bacterium]MCI6546805.1 Maf family protein [Spirochaetia bacterium]